MKKKTGSSPLTLTTCGLVLHSLLLIEIQLNGISSKDFAFVELNEIVNHTKNTFLTKPNIFIYKIIQISIKACFFILSADQSFEMFLSHNDVATISESFALNL